MKLTNMFLATAVVGLGLACAGATAQSAQDPNHNQNPSQQDQAQPPQAGQQPNTAQSQDTKVFSGKIVKTGTALVLSDPDGKTTYQLDDQAKAQDFVNKNVKVTGTLDASTGMIRVSAIEPA